jgi:DNA replication protein DnaC
MFVSPACIKGSFEEIQEYFDLMKEPDLLIIDDLGNEINNQFFIKEFYKLIDYRYIYKKGIILNTNLSVDGLIALLGDRTIDRLREMVLFFIFKTTQSKRVSIQDWC